jgi:regulator of ribonuclease activity A
MTFATADLSDAHPDAQVAEPLFADFGGIERFHGPVVTLKVFEDNALVRTALEERGAGRILVIDGGGSLRCALVGGNLAKLGVDNGWHGVVVNGCIRDAEEIGELPIGVKALATHPRRSEKGLHTGQRGRPVTFAGVTFHDGHWLYADIDGLLVAQTALTAG